MLSVFPLRLSHFLTFSLYTCVRTLMAVGGTKALKTPPRELAGEGSLGVLPLDNPSTGGIEDKLLLSKSPGAPFVPDAVVEPLTGETDRKGDKLVGCWRVCSDKSARSRIEPLLSFRGNAVCLNGAVEKLGNPPPPTSKGSVAACGSL